MRVLIIKLSSFGDVVHTLPSITDCKIHYPDITIDWVVEEAFVDIVKAHPGIQQVYPVALRRWRHQLHMLSSYREIYKSLRLLRAQKYDLIIDMQGLLKSALLGSLIKAKKLIGFDKGSAREPFSARFYHQGVAIDKGQHAIARLRALMASIFGYSISSENVDYGLEISFKKSKRNIIFIHGTSWETKLWPLEYWKKLAKIVGTKGYQVYLPSWGEKECARAAVIAKEAPNIRIVEAPDFSELSKLLSNACASVSVDTGLSHLAAAFGLPNVALYGPTSAYYTGPVGANQKVLSSQLSCAPCKKRYCARDSLNFKVLPPCFEEISPEIVWANLSKLLDERANHCH